MAYALGLTLYSLANRRDGPAQAVAWPARPPGRVVWVHAPDPDTARPMAQLARRIVEEEGHPVLLTLPADAAAPAPVRGVHLAAPPVDAPTEVAAFLAHWQPDCAVFGGGEVRPVVVSELLERQIPLAMVHARPPMFPSGREGWFPGLMRGLLAEFPEIHAIDGLAARAFRKAGASASRVIEAGRMEDGSAALPCNEAERAALARLIGSRPVWLAADLPEAEETAVLAAQRDVLRQAHRLLLIIVPRDPLRAAGLVDRAEAEGLVAARRGADADPEPEIEVYVAEQPSEYGLWYRLAPMTFLGGSLSATGCLRNPMEAAALGSAVIHGPRPGPWGTAFGRLGAARAARSVASTADLTEAVSDLMSPDRAARLAGAAWAVASDGVEVTDRAVALVRRLLGED